MQPITATWHSERWQLELNEDHHLTLIAKDTLKQMPIASVSGLPQRGIKAFALNSYFQVRWTENGAGLTFFARGKGGIPPKKDETIPQSLQPYAALFDPAQPATVMDFSTAAFSVHAQGNVSGALKLVDFGLTRFPNDFELLKLAIQYAEQLNTSAVIYFKQIITHSKNPNCLPFLKSTQLLTTYSPLTLAPVFEQALTSDACLRGISINPDGTYIAIYQIPKNTPKPQAIILCNLTNQTDFKVIPVKSDDQFRFSTVIGFSNLLLGAINTSDLEITSVTNHITELLYCCYLEYKRNQDVECPIPLPTSQLYNIHAAFHQSDSLLVLYPDQLYLQKIEGYVTTFCSDFDFLKTWPDVKANNLGNNKMNLLYFGTELSPSRYLVDQKAHNLQQCTASFSPAAQGCGLMIEENEVRQCYLGIATHQDNLEVVTAFYNMLIQANDPEALTALCGLIKYDESSNASQNVRQYLSQYCTQFKKLPDQLAKRFEDDPFIDAKLRTKYLLLEQEINDLPLRRKATSNNDSLKIYEKDLERRATKLIDKLLQKAATTLALNLIRRLRDHREGPEIGLHEDQELEAFLLMKDIRGHQDRMLFLLKSFLDQKSLTPAQAIQKLETAKALQLPFTVVNYLADYDGGNFTTLIDDNFNECIVWRHRNGTDLFLAGKKTPVFSFSSPIHDCVSLTPTTLCCILADGTLYSGEPHQLSKQKVSLNPAIAPQHWCLCPLSSQFVAIYGGDDQTIHLFDCFKQTFLSPINCSDRIWVVAKIDKNRLAVLCRRKKPKVVHIHTRQETPFFVNECARGLIVLSKNQIFIECEKGGTYASVHDLSTDSTVVTFDEGRMFDGIGKINSNTLLITSEGQSPNLYQKSQPTPVQTFKRLKTLPQWCGGVATVFSNKQFFSSDNTLSFILKEWKPEQLALLDYLHHLYIKNQQITHANALDDDLIHGYITIHSWINLLNLMTRYGNSMSKRKLLVLLLAQKKLGQDDDATSTLLQLSKKDPLNSSYYDLAIAHFRQTMHKQQSEIRALRQVVRLVEPVLHSNRDLLFTLAQIPLPTAIPAKNISNALDIREMNKTGLLNQNSQQFDSQVHQYSVGITGLPILSSQAPVSPPQPQEKTSQDAIHQVDRAVASQKWGYLANAAEICVACTPDEQQHIQEHVDKQSSPIQTKFKRYLKMYQIQQEIAHTHHDTLRAPGDGNCLLWSIILGLEVCENRYTLAQLQNFNTQHPLYDALKAKQRTLRQGMVAQFRQEIRKQKFQEHFKAYLEAEPTLAHLSLLTISEQEEKYVALIEQDRTWNSEFEARLIASCIQRPLVICKEGYQPLPAGKRYADKTPVIVRYSSGHYDTLISRSSG